MPTNNYDPRTTTKTRFTIQAFSPQEKTGYKDMEIEIPAGLTVHETLQERDLIQAKEFEKFKYYQDANLRQQQYNLNYATKQAEHEDRLLTQKRAEGTATRQDEKEAREAKHQMWQEKNDFLKTTISYFAAKRKESGENEASRKQVAVNRTVYWPVQQKLNELLENFEAYVTEKPIVKQKAFGGWLGIPALFGKEEILGEGSLEEFLPELDKAFRHVVTPTQKPGEKPTEADKTMAKFGLNNEAQSAYSGLRAHIKMNIIDPLKLLRNNLRKAIAANDTGGVEQLKNRALQLRTNIAQQVNGLTSNFNKADDQANLDAQDKQLLGMIDTLAKQTMGTVPAKGGATGPQVKTVNDLYQQMDDAFTAVTGKKVEPLTKIPGESYIAGYMQVEGKPLLFTTGPKRERSPDDFQWTPELKKQYLASELGQYYAKTAPSEKDIAKFLAQASAGLYGNDVAEHLPSLYHGWIISRFKTNPEPIRQSIEKLKMKDVLGYGNETESKSTSQGETIPSGYTLNGQYHPAPPVPANEIVETPGALSTVVQSIPMDKNLAEEIAKDPNAAFNRRFPTATPSATTTPTPLTGLSKLVRTRTFGSTVPLEYQQTILGRYNK